MNVFVHTKRYDRLFRGVFEKGGGGLVEMIPCADVNDWLRSANVGDRVDVVANHNMVRLALPGDTVFGHIVKQP